MYPCVWRLYPWVLVYKDVCNGSGTNNHTTMTSPLPTPVYEGCVNGYLYGWVHVMHQERPYNNDSTASRLLSEVKHCLARLVLRWGTTLESRVLFSFCGHFFYSLFLHPGYFQVTFGLHPGEIQVLTSNSKQWNRQKLNSREFKQHNISRTKQN